MTYEQMASLQPALAKLLERFRPCFLREQTFSYWPKYLAGLISDLERKSIEPIALACGVPVRTLQEFLAFFAWDHDRADAILIRSVVERQYSRFSVGVLDASGHVKQGTKTPGVQRQWCGEVGKTDNCVIGQHLLYTDDAPGNPFSCVVASDLYLPQSWNQDRERCREAGIPDVLVYRPRWKIGIEQIERGMAQGLRLEWVTFDEEYGKVPEFWFSLDRLGQNAIGEVPSNFRAWVQRPSCQSLRAEHASRRVDQLAQHSPAFTRQSWKTIRIKETTRGPMVWKVKAAQVYLVMHDSQKRPIPTMRSYWLMVARNPATGEIKYLVSNAPTTSPLRVLLRVAFCRWRIEQWFERAKQEVGMGAFEVRTYTSLIRHWLSVRLALFFLACETHRLRGEKSADYLGAGVLGDPGAGLDDLGEISLCVEGEGLDLSVPSGTECSVV